MNVPHKGPKTLPASDSARPTIPSTNSVCRPESADCARPTGQACGLWATINPQLTGGVEAGDRGPHLCSMCWTIHIMLDRVSHTLNVAQRGDALVLLQSLADACTPLVFFDPQHRAVLDKLAFGNEGARQRGRAQLPAMSEDYIDAVCVEIARILKPSGYCMRWLDTFALVEGHHLRIPRECLQPVDLIAWDSLRL